MPSYALQLYPDRTWRQCRLTSWIWVIRVRCTLTPLRTGANSRSLLPTCPIRPWHCQSATSQGHDVSRPPLTRLLAPRQQFKKWPLEITVRTAFSSPARTVKPSRTVGQRSPPPPPFRAVESASSTWLLQIEAGRIPRRASGSLR